MTASILELFTIEMIALLRLTCKMIIDMHHRGRFEFMIFSLLGKVICEI